MGAMNGLHHMGFEAGSMGSACGSMGSAGSGMGGGGVGGTGAGGGVGGVAVLPGCRPMGGAMGASPASFGSGLMPSADLSFNRHGSASPGVALAPGPPPATLRPLHSGEAVSAGGNSPSASRPPAAVVSGTPVDGAADWAAYTAPDGRIYYYNAKTAVSTWEKPASS